MLWPAGLTLLLAYGAYCDITSRRLPNWLALITLIFGLTFAFATGGLEALGWHSAHMVIALVVGMALFAFGIFGGGDAKFYAGVAAYFSLSNALSMLLWVSLTGFFAILGWLIIRRLPPLAKTKREGDYAKFPYGVAISVGAAGLAWWMAFSPPTLIAMELPA